MSEPASLRASIVIPTHNRCETLRQTLGAFTRQTFPADAFEVIVVADGCVDGTAAMVMAYPAPYPLILVEQPASGPGAARNSGAARAAGEHLIFVDDDVEVGGDFVAAHVRAHAGLARRVVLGYLPPRLTDQRGLFRINLRMWWEDMFHPMRDPAYAYTYKNLLSGNFSLARLFFTEVGGFDATLRVHEDYELGYRLLRCGAHFHFAEAATGLHHEKTDARRSLRRKFDEGRADVQLGRRYPELKSTLPLHRGLRRGRYGWVQRLLFRAPTLTMALATALTALLPALEALRMRRSWHHLLYLIQHGWYWRGVVAELPTRTAVLDFLRDVPLAEGVAFDLDLKNGIRAAEEALDEQQPRVLRLWYGTYCIGDFAVPPGTEGVRGLHLRPLLRDRFKWPMFVVLLVEEVERGGSRAVLMRPTLSGAMLPPR